ncbi:alpha/beta hydrolase [Actinocorallia sp. A-T 12471]|uniref:alpha/beta hydrolase n=1 Tax=Actinocorallia sp. A-T 12471 TaxID=3089813 RepID=UPI0029D1DD99|nr:alpha/beta hydrolase [Actinocorallia sp. A-T 12471]MDX6744868.1 alpha/beta hydrolase [Actinocorallia sp. A-T 12471]
MDVVIQSRAGIGLPARVFLFLLRFWLRPLMRYTPFTPKVLRHAARLDAMTGVMRAPRGTVTVPVPFDGFPAEWVYGPGVSRSGGGKVILYFHGGGFIVGGLRTHRRMIARLSAASGAPALSVAYRQLPSTTLAGTVEDCVAAYRYLLDQGFAAEEIVIAGDSAGGYLTFATPLQALREGLPAPGGLVALSPLTDLDHAAKLAHPNLGLDPYIPGPRLPELNALLLGGAALDPLHSPVNGELAALPPTLIHCGSTEILRVDAELMADRLSSAGVPVTLVVWDRQPHVFQIFADFCREGLTSLAEMGTFIRALPAAADRAA